MMKCKGALRNKKHKNKVINNTLVLFTLGLIRIKIFFNQSNSTLVTLKVVEIISTNARANNLANVRIGHYIIPP